MVPQLPPCKRGCGDCACVGLIVGVVFASVESYDICKKFNYISDGKYSADAGFAEASNEILTLTHMSEDMKLLWHTLG